MADHLVVLQHGIWGTPDELENIKDALDERYPGRLILLNSDINVDKTMDGVADGGKRLADQIREQAPPRGGRISFVCHSLGGVYARQALFLLEDAGWFESTGIVATNFVTTASPHLGIAEVGAFWRGGITVLGFALGSTIQDLALKTDTILHLSTGAGFRALERFQRRAVYGNLQDDMWCRVCSSLILPSPPDVGEMPAGVPQPLAPCPSNTGDELGTFPTGHHAAVRTMLDRLSTLSWERYVVDFPAAKFSGAAHAKICQHGLLDTNNDGVRVVSHICHSFRLGEESGRGQLRITIDKQGAASLGLDVDHNATSLGIRKIKRGPMKCWNLANTNSQVKLGHAIVSVNGVCGSAAKLLEAISATNILDIIVIPTPQEDSDSDEEGSESDDAGELHITIERKGPHGLGIDFYHAPTALKITRVKTGAINDWNIANPSSLVTAGHAIVEVNGFCGSAEKMLERIQADTKLAITLEFGTLSQAESEASEGNDED